MKKITLALMLAWFAHSNASATGLLGQNYIGAAFDIATVEDLDGTAYGGTVGGNLNVSKYSDLFISGGLLTGDFEKDGLDASFDGSSAAFGMTLFALPGRQVNPYAKVAIALNNTTTKITDGQSTLEDDSKDTSAYFEGGIEIADDSGVVRLGAAWDTEWKETSAEIITGWWVDEITLIYLEFSFSSDINSGGIGIRVLQ